MKKFKKLIALLLAMMMVFSIAPVAAFAEGYLSFEEGIVSEPTEQKAVEQEIGVIDLVDPDGAETYDADSGSSVPATVIACSDFQNPKGNEAGARTVTNILTQMQSAGYKSADGFLFCGDYDYYTVGSTSSTEAGITALKNAVTSTYDTLTDDRMVFVQGNHDAAGSTGLAASGAHDADGYGVFVINEDDYMWNNSSESRIQQTANNLKSYLDAKVTAKYAKPIFVVSHLPLHYSMRTRNDGDGKYANYIFDVLNEAGANGLNIIFLYGHDHSNGWDDYLGGAAVYLAKGDQINIAQGSKTAFNVETLNFTYMNAGYTGYYSAVNTGAETTLTMTVFSITGDAVTVERYSTDGVHNLKSKGVTNNHKNESGYYAPNTTVYGSPKEISLTAVTPQATVTNGNVSVTAAGLTGLTAAKKTVTFDTSKYSAYASYDINPAGYTPGDKATVKITLDENDGFDSSRKVTVIDQTGTNPDTNVSIVNGTVTFTTNHFSTYDIAQEALAEPTERTYTLVTSETELVSGDQYLLIYDGTQFVLPKIVTKSNSSGSQRTGMDLEATDVASGGPATITGQYQAKEWQLVSSSGGWLLSNGTQQIKLTDTENQDITATFEDAGSPFSLNFDTSHLVSFTHGNWELNYNQNRGLINGYDSTSTAARMYIYRLTDAGTVDPSGGDWVTISDGQGKTIFRLVKQLTAGKKYLIVNSNQAGSANAVNLNGEDINSASVTIVADAKGEYIEAPANTAQWTYTSAKKFQNVSNDGIYLRGGKNTGDSLKTTNDSGDKRTTWRYDAYGLYETSNNCYISSNFTMLSPGSSSNRVYIYEEATLQTTAEYAKLTGPLTYTVTPGTLAADALAAVKTGIDVVTSSDKTNGTTLPDDNANITWTLDSSYRGEAGEYAVTISYKNKVLGTAKVIVPELTVDHIEVTPMEGTVQKGASNYAKTGSTLTVTYSDGSTRTVDITLEMLSGNFNKNTVGTYTGLTVTYGGKTVTGYTLHVTPKTGNDYPEYPHEGAVRVGKTAEGVNFQSSGIAKVELSATGVPVKKGADVIVMVDTSSSMTTTVKGSSKSRIEVLRESLTNLINRFQAVGADGEPQDIRVAIADFNGYVTTGADNSQYRLKSADHLNGTTTRGGENNDALVYTGSAQLNANAFVTASDAVSVIDSINTSSGTNYDYAFDAVYQLGEAILRKNAEDGKERDLFVIFMSDGAPFQYNYFSSKSDAANWNNWLQGTYASASDVPSDSEHKYFYNGSGNKHRMAEAIKGDPNAKYTVIRKDSTDNYGGQQYMTQLPGLGATMYSIGFCLEQDNQITVASMEYVLKNISSDPTKFYYKVNTANELSNAFAAIGNEIAYAATNARFVDTMGANYDLQMASSTYPLSDGTTDTITPEITVQAYDIYTAADGVAESEIGKRKGTSTVLETVTFNEGGTEAYSDKKSGNILIDGVICANTFWYNTTGNTVSIDTNGDGTNDYNLAPETFYWKMGTINQTELALSYYVYLTGSMDGTREKGSYPTNESATLHYTNWLSNEVKKDTVSPVLAWKSANVSYAFYLVNEKGEIIVNKSTGQTGSFVNKVAVTNPVVYSEVLLNSAASVQANILASGVLPEGYALYDTDAAYNVWINSNSTGGWTITKGTNLVATTYVTEYGEDPTTELSTENSSYDYTHTVVWFAVKYQISCVPDAVVIDFGLPVDISVLANDILGEGAAVMGLAAVNSIPDAQGTAELAGEFSTNDYTGTYGTATINGTNVRYTPGSMKMDNMEKFAYAAKANLKNDNKYYYSTVTVIPATTVYYEDSFVDFYDVGSSAKKTAFTQTTESDAMGEWYVEGDANTTAEQALSKLGDKAIYGYDPAYNNSTMFSMDSAKKVTVNTNGQYAQAKFTFKGTGFDVISLTNSDSGAITVEVLKDGTTAKTKDGKDAFYLVNNYYGYKQENGQWVVDPTATNTLYQIPVMKVSGLNYDTYTAVITVDYAEFFDKTNDNKYSFWLDAIRIYDPMGVDNETYTKDDEGFPQYIKLRNELAGGNNVTVGNEKLLFIDGAASADVATYANFGPNNEVYLAKGQAISFKLNIKPGTQIASVQIGAKAPNGNAAKLVVNGVDVVSELKTATEMYYEISKDGNGNFTVTNTGTGILSLTNLKITYSATGGSVSLASMSPEEQTSAVMMVRAMFAPPAPTVFEPETFTVSLKNYKDVYVREYIKVTVTTSDDVKYITVGDKRISRYDDERVWGGFRKGFVKTGKRVWSYYVSFNTAGQQVISVVAYDADGLASEAVENTVNVKPRSAWRGKKSEWHI